MEQLNIKHECKRYGCAVLAATVFAINIKTFVRAGGLYPGGVSGLTLLIQNIFAQFLGLQIPYTVINILLNSIPVYVGFRFIGKKFTISSCCVILLSSVLTDLIPAQPITYDSLLISIFGGLINGFSISLCLIGNTSSGGTDFFAIYFSEKSGKDIWNYVFCAASLWPQVSCLAGTVHCTPLFSSSPPPRLYRCFISVTRSIRYSSLPDILIWFTTRFPS